MHSNRASGKLAACQTVAGRKRLQTLTRNLTKVPWRFGRARGKNSAINSEYSVLRSVVSTRKGDTQTAEISTKTKCGVLEL
jgi:hypothetical protein